MNVRNWADSLAPFASPHIQSRGETGVTQKSKKDQMACNVMVASNGIALEMGENQWAINYGAPLKIACSLLE